MAERRMISKSIVDADAFLELPMSSQLLYFHLCMRADDEGFVNNPKSILRLVGAKDDDLKLLYLKKYIIPFESGIIVIIHWKIHNYIQKDRFHETKYKYEKSLLALDENKAYNLVDTGCIQNVSTLDTQVRIDKDRLGNNLSHKEDFWCSLKKTNEGIIDENCSNCYLINKCPFEITDYIHIFESDFTAVLYAMDSYLFSNRRYDFYKRKNNVY